MQPALEVLLGSQAKGLSASTVSRLKQYGGPSTRPGSIVVWTMIAGYWADGIYSGLRAEQQRLSWVSTAWREAFSGDFEDHPGVDAELSRSIAGFEGTRYECIGN